MFKNTLKRLGAIVLALAMAMSVMMVSAFAAGTTATTGSHAVGNSTKQLKVKANSYAPNTTFTFTVAPATNSNSPTSGLTFANGATTTTFTSPTSDFATSDADQTITLGTAELYVNVDAFKPVDDQSNPSGNPVPGIYEYTITESANTVEGVKIASPQNVKVVIERTEENGADVYHTYLVAAGKESAEDGKDAKGDGTFLNEYGTGTDNDTLHDLTVTKKVDGNMGDKNETFAIQVTVTGTDTNEKYVAKVGNTVSEVVSGTAKTFSLKHGECVTIYGLSTSDTFAVTETEAKGHSATYTLDNAAYSAGAVTNMSTSDHEVVVTNTKTATTPTGVIMNIAPYVLMVALAAGIAFFFLRRRNAE